MFIWDLLTGFTDVLELIFGFVTGVFSFLATLVTLNERLLLFVIDSFQTATDEVYYLVEFLEKLFTWQLSREDVGHYGFVTAFETLNNTCDRILYWFLRVLQQFLTPVPVGVSLAIVFAVLSLIHRRKLIRCVKYILPNRLQNRWTRHLFVGDTNDDDEVYWNANENLGLDNDHVLRAETLGGERDSSSDSDDVATYSASTDGTADSHAEQFGTRRKSSRKNVDNIRCSMRSQEDKLLCVICQDKSKSVLVLPCRHLCMCEACAKVISSNAELPKICPLCRTAINRLINVYV